MSVEIRKIQEKDISDFYNVLSAVAKEGIYLLTTTPPLYDKIVNFITDNSEKNHSQYVALVNNKIVGWADIIPLQRNTMDHVGHLGMGLLSEFRSKGVGSKLLEKTIAHAWDQKLTRIELEVFSDNEIAIKLYEKYNFEVEGVKKNARFYGNSYQDITMMGQCSI